MRSEARIPVARRGRTERGDSRASKRSAAVRPRPPAVSRGSAVDGAVCDRGSIRKVGRWSRVHPRPATVWAGPLLAPRCDARYLIVVGTGLTCLAFQWFGHLHGSALEYYAAWCVYMLGYLLSGPIPHQIIISHWYRRNRGQAMGVAYIGGALAGAIGNKLAPWLVSFMSYRSALQFLGLVLLLAWPIALFILKDRPEDLGQNIDGDVLDDFSVDAAESMSFAELGRRSSFWLLLVGSAASIGSIACVNFLMKFAFEEQGFTDQAARDRLWSTASFAALIAAT